MKLILSVFAIATLLTPHLTRAEPAFDRETVLFIGSSTMGHWKPRIAEDFAPIPVRNFGENGTDFRYLQETLPEWTKQFPAKRWVVYSGDNDLYEIPRHTPEQIDQDMEKTVGLIRDAIPDSLVFVVSIKCRPSAEQDCPAVIQTNKLMVASIGKMKNVTYVDTFSAMANAGGDPKRFFDADGIHLSSAGYDLWRDTIKPVLLKSIVTSAQR